MHDNKAPGPDGLSTEFYRTFWSLLAEDLVRIFNIGYDKEQLSESQMSSLLRPLFKKGERDRIENWRPISIEYRLQTAGNSSGEPLKTHPTRRCTQRPNVWDTSEIHPRERYETQRHGP